MVPDVVKKPCVYTNPLTIGGKSYTIKAEVPGFIRDGNRLWPCSIALANYVASMPLKPHKSADIEVAFVGDGLGLPGIVAATLGAVPTVIDRDVRIWELIYENYKANSVWGRFRCQDWSDATGSFDAVLGSEIIYKSYGMKSLAAFVKKTWNRSLPCFFVASVDHTSDEFMGEMRDAGFEVWQRLHSFTLPSGESGLCYAWEVKP